MLYVGDRKIAERVAAPASALTARSVVDTRRPGALIVGGDCGSLSVIRSLGRHGIPSRYVTDIDFLAKFSRYTKGSAAWPGPGHPTALSFLVQLAEQEGLNGWLLIPIGDAEVEFVAKNRERLAATFRLTTPDWDTIRWAVDKKLTYQRAEMLGIPFPRTYNVRRLEDVERLDFLFPLILKPAKKEEINAFTLAKAWRVDDRAELRARFIQAASLVGPGAIVVQELIPGSGSAQYSYAGLWHNGSPTASLVARRTRQLPVDFGRGSTFVETLDNEDIEDAAVRFLRSINYDGVVEIEFKFDDRERCFKLLDVNPRFWTWNALTQLAGLDLPYLLWQQTMGQTGGETRRGLAGKSWMYVTRDIPAALHDVRAGRLTVLAYLRSLLKASGFAVFAWDDPLPALVEFPLTLWRRLVRFFTLRPGDV
jgi:predicted ATP-grasp superfamily ATP-dependent carboligase